MVIKIVLNLGLGNEIQQLNGTNQYALDWWLIALYIWYPMVTLDSSGGQSTQLHYLSQSIDTPGQILLHKKLLSQSIHKVFLFNINVLLHCFHNAFTEACNSCYKLVCRTTKLNKAYRNTYKNLELILFVVLLCLLIIFFLQFLKRYLVNLPTYLNSTISLTCL